MACRALPPHSPRKPPKACCCPPDTGWSAAEAVEAHATPSQVISPYSDRPVCVAPCPLKPHLLRHARLMNCLCDSAPPPSSSRESGRSESSALHRLCCTISKLPQRLLLGCGAIACWNGVCRDDRSEEAILAWSGACRHRPRRPGTYLLPSSLPFDAPCLVSTPGTGTLNPSAPSGARLCLAARARPHHAPPRLVPS